MKKLIEKYKDIYWIAHRGLPYKAVENSNTGFELAGQLPFFGIETDLHLTKDEHIVAHHDHNIKRITGLDALISELDLNSISDIKLKDSLDNIPKFSTYLNICKKYNKVAIIELKVIFKPHQLTMLFDEIKIRNYLDKVIIISFHMDNLINIRKLYPDLTLQFLSSKFNQDIFKNLIDYHLELSLYHEAITKDIIEEMHKNNLKVAAWTVNNLTSIERLVEIGIDYITTDGFHI
ncbi:glycerophosphodiester phosphodiesterase [Acholeplasma granularum]|uniref:glycerophosphodiester phosphodiesterase n=1 Tax=Acholeplasma granularum TaxID=264635 RepID=UPI00047075FD|nr:glycerophosphodiester phosphodiesterase family protein [Acholeplasma granularum]